MSTVSAPEAASAAEQSAGEGHSLKSRALRGSAWTMASYGSENAIRLASNFILARLFDPDVFAITLIAGLVYQAMQMFSDLGVAWSVVRHKDGLEPWFLNTAWTVQTIRGVLLWVGACVLAWPVAKFYGVPVLASVIPIGALSAVFSGLMSSKVFIARRNLDLSRVMVLRVGESALRFAVTVAWALVSPTVWAIVCGAVIANAAHNAATHLWLPGPRSRFQWDPRAVRELLGFGRWVFVSTAITFFAVQTDKLLLGTFTTMTVLGVYAVAFPLAKLPNDVVGMLTGAVLFPALASRARDSHDELRRTLERSRGVALPVALAGTACVALGSPWFFMLYKDAYADAIWIAPALAAALWFGLLAVISDRTIPALGRAAPLAASNAVSLVVTAGACSLGWWLAGLPGFIGGVGAGGLAGYLVVATVLQRAGLPVLLRDLKYTAVLGVCLAVPFGAYFMSPRQPGWMPLAALAAVSGVASAAVVVHALRRCLGLLRGQGRG